MSIQALKSNWFQHFTGSYGAFNARIFTLRNSQNARGVLNFCKICELHAGPEEKPNRKWTPLSIYRNNLKNREFDKEAFQNFEIELTRSKTDSSSCFGISSYFNQNESDSLIKSSNDLISNGLKKQNTKLSDSFMVKENPKYPIHILITHPRATATAFEKIMKTRKEMTVLHAPFLDPYLFKKYGHNHPLTRGLSDSNVTFDDVRKRLFQLAEHNPVFFKESGYLFIDYLKNNPDFYNNPQIKIAFLVRDPAKSIISFYRRMPKVDNSIIGHQQLWDLFMIFKKNLDKPPIVIDSDELLKNPLRILNCLGERWGMNFDKTNLRWESGYCEDWRVKDWYAQVAASTKLGPYLGDIPRQENGIPEYGEVSDNEARKRLQHFYQFQSVYYKKLLQFSIRE